MGRRTREFLIFVVMALVGIPAMYVFDNLVYAKRFGDDSEAGVLILLLVIGAPVAAAYLLFDWFREKRAKRLTALPDRSVQAKDSRSPGRP